MKRIHAILILLIPFILTGCGKRSEIVITGHITGEIGNRKLVYTVPIDGTCYVPFNDTLQTVDEQGAFELKFKSWRPVFIKFWLTGEGRAKFFKLPFEPGNQYHLIVNADTDSIIPSGANEKGMVQYAGLSDPAYIQMDAGDLWQDPSVVSIFGKISERKWRDLGPFRLLYNAGAISKSFLKAVEADRESYYIAMESVVLLSRMYSGDSTIHHENILERLDQIYMQYPVNSPSFDGVSFRNSYVLNYIQSLAGKDSLSELTKQGVQNTYCINEAKNILSGKQLEFFFAEHLFSQAFQQHYEKELITLFEQFEKDYPRSRYTRYLKPVIEPIVKYHEIVKQPFGESVAFIDNREDLHTLEEVIQPFRGKKIFIDIWATWCGPCKEEFKNGEALSQILAAQDAQMLYISIDDDAQEQKWLEGIKFFNLAGAHLRAGGELLADLYRRYDPAKGDYMYIPWYLFVDEQGNIVREHARAPSEIVKDGKLP
jgi:thiol-disulfide isomerase/thioredoxin